MKKLFACMLVFCLATTSVPIYAEDANGWIKENGVYYYYEMGQKKTGWFKDGNCWYYLETDTGIMKTGWIADNEYWYFMGESGVMQTNTWIESNGNKYFIKGNGTMATDMIKDGYELGADGKAIPFSESKSELYDPNIDYSERTIEGNLYIHAENKEIELNQVTVQGKIILLSSDSAPTKLTITDSKINQLLVQNKDAEILLSGESEIRHIIFDEAASISEGKEYKGSVDFIQIQSQVKQPVIVDIPVKKIETNHYAGLIVKSKADELTINRKSNIEVSAKIKKVIITRDAKESVLKLNKFTTIDELSGDTKFTVEGEGSVKTLYANAEGIEFGKELYLLKVVKGEGIILVPEIRKRPVSSSSNSNTTVEPDSVEVKSLNEFNHAILNGENCTIPKGVTITFSAPPEAAMQSLDIQNLTITIKGTLKLDHYQVNLFNNGEMVIDGGSINYANNGMIMLSDNTAEFKWKIDSTEHILKRSDSSKVSHIVLRENLITLREGATVADMNILTEFSPLFNRIRFSFYTNEINLSNLENSTLEFAYVTGKVQLKGSEKDSTIVLLNGADAIFTNTNEIHVIYNNGQLAEVLTWGDTVIHKQINAKLTGGYEGATLTVAKDAGDIDVENSKFYDEHGNKFQLISHGSGTFKWNEEDEKWIEKSKTDN